MRDAFSTGRTDHETVSRYDLVLAVLPVPLAVGAVGGLLTSVPTAIGAGAGGLPSALVVGYGPFVDTPETPDASGRERDDAP
ncbi:hypothetical protein SAMN04487948_1226 [Halogranum amylolyticum]|uniref:Uncharacterized protein n=1 Tax=Halogranum amylolyticum TaxID=660520 RepID=A0A1H8W1M6_9EURY|nr:hypothetical protein [Halogranum amylolyticum]SEP21423.1 hypothetical protein SAMN04487948_1226 [Halogranum amylolyticum]